MSGQLTRGRHACPSCSKELDGYTGEKDETPPAGGDVTVCAYCRTVLQFEAGALATRRMTVEEIKRDLDSETQAQLRKIQAGLRQVFTEGADHGQQF